MAGAGAFEAGDLAPHPHPPELTFQQPLDGARQLAHRKLRLVRGGGHGGVEAERIGRRAVGAHRGGCYKTDRQCDRPYAEILV